MSYLRFQAVGPTPGWPKGGLAVLSRSQGSVLGVISWYRAWRQHVLEPAPETIWSTECLAEVRAKLDELNTTRTGAVIA